MSDVVENPRHKLVTQLLVIANTDPPPRPLQPLPAPERPNQPLPEPTQPNQPAAEPENLTLEILNLDLVSIIKKNYKVVCFSDAIPCKIEIALTQIVLDKIDKNALFTSDLAKVAKNYLMARTSEIFITIQKLDDECDAFYSKNPKPTPKMAAFLNGMQAKLDEQALLLEAAVQETSDSMAAVVQDLIGSHNASKMAVRANKCQVAISLFKGASTVIVGSVMAGVTFGATTPLAIYAIARDIGGIVELISGLVTDIKTKEKRITAYFNALDKCLIEIKNPNEKLKKKLVKAGNTTMLSAAAIASKAFNINLPDIGSMKELIEGYNLDLIKMDHHRNNIGKKIASLNKKIADLKKEIETSPPDPNLDEILMEAETRKKDYLAKAEMMYTEINDRLAGARLMQQRFDELEKLAFSGTGEVGTVAELFIGVALVAGGSGDGLELIVGLMTDIGQNLYDRFGEDAIAWLVDQVRKRQGS